ncbi:AraC family transcriptional regulator [Marinobacter sp. SS5-14b]|uniref:AraC family transcriptional regulator n=1 Tax=Marinobacter sp. SS5-14b TaxID=3050456 RepID=UPI0026DFA970|nr:AraC family transcriptional regulator [Marinobacter sp. SS5-14b]
MTLEATVSMGWVNTVIDAAGRLGVDTETLLAASGIPAEALAWERWPIDHITRLWHGAERCTGDSGFGLKAGAGVRHASLDVVSFALQSAATLREAIMLVQKYQRLISDGGRFQMLPGHRGTWIVYHPRQGRLVFSPHQLEAVLAAVITFSGWLTGADLKPIKVQFSQARLGAQAGYQAVFGCPVEFEQAFSGLLVDNAELDKVLPQADPGLSEMHEQFSAGRLVALGMQGASMPDLRQWLVTQMSQKLPRRRDAARALGVSERTLARRLQGEGLTFNGLLDDVRRQLALEEVSLQRQSLADIAQSLGYAEASTFYRAFQRWTGLPPVRWRKENAG